MYWMGLSRTMIIIIPLVSSLAVLSSIIFVLSQGSCPDGHFSCGDNEKCIKQKNICDGHDDCPAGEDEDPLYCADLHGGFWGIVNNLRYKTPNDTCVLDEVPKDCLCTEHTFVYCTGLSLSNVPSSLSKYTTRIILADNNISLGETDFKNYSLDVIHLGNNSLSILPKTIFHEQKNLQKLFLYENRLSNLPEEVFYGLGKLSWLFIHNNILSELNFENWDLRSLSWLDLSHNKLSLKNKSFPFLPSLTILWLDWNEIEEISENMFLNLTALRDLSIGWNKIKIIHPSAFILLQNLEDLTLRNNYLEYLDEEIFSFTKNLTKLSLGGNNLLTLGQNLFSSLIYLKSLDLQDIDIDNINTEMFSVLTNLDFMYFKRFRYCTYVPHVPKCFPLDDGSTSASDLLMSTFLRITLWLVVAFTLLANGLVLWHRQSSSAYTSPLNILITSLADLLMGVYLSIIGYEDFFLKGKFMVNARGWMSSWLCTCAGIIAMLSSEVSIFMLLLISAERYLLIAAPLGEQKSLQPKVALMSVTAVWIFSLMISLLPVMQWRGALSFYGSNSFCFPLHIDDPYLMGWQYSAVVFLGINFFGIIGIAVLYFGLFLSIYKTRHATSLNVKDSEFALKFFFIVITNACCWLPIIIFKILAFLDVSLSGELYGWLAVFVIPINSAINPILYTFSIPQYRITIRQRIPKGGHKKRLKRKTKREPPINSKPTSVCAPPLTSEEQI